MEVQLRKSFEYKKLLESGIIISIGLFMHLNRMSIIELKYSKLPLLTPNAASVVFVFSVLCVLSKMRPLWPRSLRRPQRFLIFLVELAVILYSMDFLLRQVWLPTLKLLNFVCHFLGQYVIVANEDFLTNNAPRLSTWIRNDAYYLARFVLALIAFLFMVDTCGVFDYFHQKLWSHRQIGNYMEDDVDSFDDEQRATASRDFDVNELPFVPQEDLLNLGHRVGARRRRQPFRKAKRVPPCTDCGMRSPSTTGKMTLNDPDNECTC